MRVTIVTQDDPLYILPFFRSFFAGDLAGVEVTAVYACRAMGSRKRTKLLRELATLYGFNGFVKLLLIHACTRIASTRAFQAILQRPMSLEALVKARGIPYERIENPNAAISYDKIATQIPDVLVSVACPYVFKSKLLELPSIETINIHHAPLPRYKGMMPTFWQMYHGEHSAAITIHTMAPEIDGGEILFQQAFPVRPEESMHQLIRRSKTLGGKFMLDVLRQYATGNPPHSTVPPGEGSYFTFPTSEEMKDFRSRGLRAI